MLYTKTELAEKTGISRVTISRLLNGKIKNPSYATVNAVACAVNCSTDELLKECGRHERKTKP